MTKYQQSIHKAVRLTDLLSKKKRSDNLMAMWKDYGMFGFFIKYVYNHRVETSIKQTY